MEPVDLPKEEQYPLLHGVGTNEKRVESLPSSPVPIVLKPSPSKFNLSRVTCFYWSEFVSACWMTFVLVGISFLVFGALGFGAYRRHPLIMKRANITSSGPVKQVFLYQLVANSYVNFIHYSEFISLMAVHYPSLYINVIFLIEDSTQSSFRNSHHKLFNKLVPRANIFEPNPTFLENNRRELRDFQIIHPNVNITVMKLSEYMSKTTLKYSWRRIQTPFLTFYIRAEAIHKFGGISMDLCTFSTSFNKYYSVDRKVEAILKHHNDGEPGLYANSLEAVEKRNEFTDILFDMVSRLMGQASHNKYKSHTDNKNNINIESAQTMKKRKLLTFNEESNKTESIDVNFQISKENDTTVKAYTNNQQPFNQSVTSNSDLHNLSSAVTFLTKNKTQNTFKEDANGANIVFVDMTILDDLSPPFFEFPLPEFPNRKISYSENTRKYTENQIISTKTQETFAIDSSGLFIASALPYHPFLHKILATSTQGKVPRFIIEDLIFTQCSGLFRSNKFCDNIHLIFLN